METDIMKLWPVPGAFGVQNRFLFVPNHVPGHGAFGLRW
jgi:hypothetical protein